MNSDIRTMATMELTQTLRTLNRRVAELAAQSRTPVNSPEEVVEAAERDQRLAELQKERLAMGEELLKREREQRERKRERLQQDQAKASEVAQELLDRLPSFGKRAQKQLSGIADEFSELQELSNQLFWLTNKLLGSDVPSPVSASMRIEPTGLNTLLKRELTRIFGDGVARAQADSARMIKSNLMESVVEIQSQTKVRGGDHAQ